MPIDRSTFSPRDYTTLYVPRGSKQAYANAAYRKSFKTIKEIGGVDGDANGDEVVNAADIVEVVNHIMGTSSEKFNFNAADINHDGVVNAADIVQIVNLIMEAR